MTFRPLAAREPIGRLPSVALGILATALAAASLPSARASTLYLAPYLVSTFAGLAPDAGADGPASNATFVDPSGVAVDANGNIYVADTTDSTIRVIYPSGTVSTLAGLVNSP